MYFYCGREVNSGILNVIMVGLCQVFVWDIINNKYFFLIIKNLKLELRLSGVGEYLSKLCTYMGNGQICRFVTYSSMKKVHVKGHIDWC